MTFISLKPFEWRHVATDARVGDSQRGGTQGEKKTALKTGEKSECVCV